MAPAVTTLPLRGRVTVFQPRPGLGDLIWHLPIIRAMADRSEGRTVTLVTKPSTQADALLAGDPAIERVVWFDRNPRQGSGRHDGPLGFPRLVATLRACRAETCVLLHHAASLAAAIGLAGIPHRHGYGYSRAQRFWLSAGPFLGPEMEHQEAAQQAAAYARAAGLPDLPEPGIRLDPASSARVAQRLAAHPRPWVALGIGSNGANRQWGAARFAQLGSALLAGGGGTVFLLAGRNEAALAHAVRQAIPGGAAVQDVVGWPLPDLAALLAEADLFIGNDSGPMNLRAAVGRPAYGLFGASGPLLHSARIYAVVPPEGPRSGMDNITVPSVLEAIARPAALA